MAIRYLRIIEYVFEDEDTAADNLARMTHTLALPHVTMRSAMLPMEAVEWSYDPPPLTGIRDLFDMRIAGPEGPRSLDLGTEFYHIDVLPVSCPRCGNRTVVYNGNYFCADPDPSNTLDGVKPSHNCGWELDPERDDVRPWMRALIEARQARGLRTDHIERALAKIELET